MRDVIATALFIGLMVSGCATIAPPTEYLELKRRMAAAPAEEHQYDDARTYLKAAEEALDDRDEAALKRFASLGIIEARIAEARLLQVSLVRATEREVDQSRQLEQDVARWRSKVERLLAEQARQQMREHIEAVIEKETMAAAAAEELQSHMGDVDEEKLKTARHRVAERDRRRRARRHFCRWDRQLRPAPGGGERLRERPLGHRAPRPAGQRRGQGGGRGAAGAMRWPGDGGAERTSCR